MTSAVSSLRRPRAAAALALLLTLTACNGPWLPVATPDDAARAQVSVDELNQGRRLVLRRCSTCHQPPSPTELRAAEWPAEVAEMAERSGLQPGEDALLVRYLVTFARDRPLAPR